MIKIMVAFLAVAAAALIVGLLGAELIAEAIRELHGKE